MSAFANVMSRVIFYESLADDSDSFTKTNVAITSGRSSSGYLLPNVFAIKNSKGVRCIRCTARVVNEKGGGGDGPQGKVIPLQARCGPDGG